MWLLIATSCLWHNRQRASTGSCEVRDDGDTDSLRFSFPSPCWGRVGVRAPTQVPSGPVEDWTECGLVACVWVPEVDKNSSADTGRLSMGGGRAASDEREKGELEWEERER